jgi:alpha-tubulin suppressor-like RCC1 family protein
MSGAGGHAGAAGFSGAGGGGGTPTTCSASHCCGDGDCPAALTGQPGACDAGTHSCHYTCPTSTQLCVLNGGASCIASTLCCGCSGTCQTDADCLSGHFCSGQSCRVAAVAVASGLDSSCALLADATVDCWGGNSYGDLGQGPSAALQGSTTPLPVTLPKPATEIAVGGYSAFVLLNDGTVWSWGYNVYGELGQGTASGSVNDLVGVPTPGQITGLPGPASAIAAGTHHACALVAGNAWCWGEDGEGEVGDGIFRTSPPWDVDAPVKVGGLGKVTALAAGSEHTCAISDGALVCWGLNGTGQLGSSFGVGAVTTPEPVSLPAGTQITSLALGGNQSCAILAGGTCECWGENNYGQLGQGTFSATMTAFPEDGIVTPAPIAAAADGPITATAVTMGEIEGCAVAASEALYCWGFNDYGAVGTGSNTTTAPLGIATPTRVTTLPYATIAVAAGGWHVCAVLQNGSVWCWGDDPGGAVGVPPAPIGW